MASSVRGGGRGGGAGAEETAPLPLPPPPRLVAAMSSSSPASIRALLSRTGGGGAADCQQSPRSLLSRILLRGGDHHGGNGGGGGGGTFGCRVRLPRRYSSTSSASSARKDDGSVVSEQSSDDVGGTARVKVVERAPELPPVDTPRSSLGSGRKKPEEELVSMNLGLGASLVLLLSKSAVELNRMVELRAQMEALASEMRQMASLGSEKQGAAAPAAALSTTSSQESTVIKDPIAAEDALSDNCSGARTADRRAVAVMDHSQMEAELQVELGRLQMQHRAVHVEKRAIAPPMQGLELPPLHVKTKNHVAADSPTRSCVDDAVVAQENADQEEEEDDDEEEEYDDEDDDDLSEGHGAVVDGNSSPPHGGVSARALERRLHELLQRRQQDRIVQLEAALDGAQRKLQEREREVVWWRDAAKLVSHRRDESRRLRCTAAS